MSSDKKTQLQNIQIVVLIILRIAIGWHFLYEGITKAIDPTWTSVGYLARSNWIFSGIFNGISNNPTLTIIFDHLNIWGLIFIGLGLILGIFIRFASISGMILILLYYIANPPFTNYSFASEGNYLIIDKNLIEFLALLVIAFIPTGSFFGLEKLKFFKRQKQRIEDQKAVKPLNVKVSKKKISCSAISRRDALGLLGAFPVLGTFIYALLRRHGIESFEEMQLLRASKSMEDAITGATQKSYNILSLKELKKGKLPSCQIKNVNISRLILGGNLVNGVAHARDLMYVSPLVKSYFSDEKIMETWHLAERCGINTMSSWPTPKFLRVLKEYRRRDGKIQWLGHSGIYKDYVGFKKCIDNGACGLYIAGDFCDRYVYEGRIDELGKAIDFLKQNGLFAGIAGHSVEVVKTCEEAGLNVDFYMKTLHDDNYWSATPKEDRKFNVRFGDPKFDKSDHASGHYHDNMWCIDAQGTIDYMKNVQKPWMAFKVLAAGSIDPAEGFRYAFENGADFIHVGIFDFQMVQDVNHVIDIFNGEMKLKRERPWIA